MDRTRTDGHYWDKYMLKVVGKHLCRRHEPKISVKDSLSGRTIIRKKSSHGGHDT